MIADIFNFAKMRAVFREVRSVSAHTPGSLVFAEIGAGLSVFEGASKSCDNNFVSDVENCYQKEPARSRVRRGGARVPRGACFAAAVMLPPDFSHPLLNDSKQMTARQRDLLRAIVEREALAWVVKAVSAERIDQINILNASFEGMSLAVAELPIRPGFLAIDGNRFRTTLDIPYRCIVKETANMRILPPRRCWPRPTATNIWSASPGIFPNTVGSATKVIRPANIAWRSAVTGLRPTTG